MAITQSLNKLFVRVSTGNAQSVISASQTNTSKIYFVEQTNEIVNNGVVYGLNPDTANDILKLQQWVGSNASIGNDVSTIIERLTALEAIRIKSEDSQYLSISDVAEGATVTPEIDVHIVALDDPTLESSSSGLVDAYEAKSYIDAEVLAAKNAASSDVEAANESVQVNTSLNADGHTTYKINTSLNLEYVAPASGNAAQIKLTDGTNDYGFVSVDSILSNGLLQSSAYDKDSGILTLTFKNADATTHDVSINLAEMLDINDMSVADNSSIYLSVDLTGGENSQAVFSTQMQTVSTADATHTGLADAWEVKQYVDSKSTDLAVSASGDTSYVDASVDASDNKHINVAAIVNDLTATAGTAGTYDAEGAQTAAPSHGTLSGVTGLVDGADAATKVKTYVDGEVAIEAARADAAILAAIKALDSSKTSDKDSNIVVNVEEVDGKLNDVVVTTQYATVSSDNASTWSLTDGDAGKLVKASDVSALADVMFANFAALDQDLTAAIEALDSSVSAADSANYVSFKVVEEDGLLSGAEINVTYGSLAFDAADANGHHAALAGTEGIAKAEDVATFVDTYDYWEEYTAQH